MVLGEVVSRGETLPWFGPGVDGGAGGGAGEGLAEVK